MQYSLRRLIGPLSIGLFCAVSVQFITWRAEDRPTQSLIHQYDDFVLSFLRQKNDTAAAAAVSTTATELLNLTRRANVQPILDDTLTTENVTIPQPFISVSSSSTNTTEETTNYDDVQKPTFAIHVGPSKTQTSTLQMDFRSMYDVLQQDNYVYLGKRRQLKKQDGISQIHTSFVHGPCLMKMTAIYKSNNGTSVRALHCWNRVHEEIQKWRRLNMSIIMSEEFVSSMNSPFWKPDVFETFTTALKEALGNEWNVVVVVGYRRYGEWLLSSVKQMHGTGCASPKARWSAGFCSPIWQTIENWTRRTNPTAKNFHWTPRVKRHWRRVFSNVKILNTHAPGHVTEKFVCDMLTNAPRTCQHVRTRAEPPKSVNVRSSLDAALTNLALTARQQGLFPDGRKRMHVIREASKYDIKFQQLPLKCPSREKLEKLLNRSLELEETLLPEFHRSPLGERVHRDEFWYLADVKKGFCSFDRLAGIVSDSKNWTELLEQLASSNATTTGEA